MDRAYADLAVTDRWRRIEGFAKRLLGILQSSRTNDRSLLDIFDRQMEGIFFTSDRRLPGSHAAADRSLNTVDRLGRGVRIGLPIDGLPLNAVRHVAKV